MSLKWSTLLCRVIAVRYVRGRNALCGYELYGIDRGKESKVHFTTVTSVQWPLRLIMILIYAYDQWAYKVVPATMEAVTYYKLT